MNDILNISGQNMALLIVVAVGIVAVGVGLWNILQGLRGKYDHIVDPETYKDIDDER